MRIYTSKIEAFLEFIIALCIIINTNTVWGRIGFGKINSIILYGTLLLLVLIVYEILILRRRYHI